LGICAGDNVDEIVEKEGETTSDDSNSWFQSKRNRTL
jgi:hypothetical protein